MVGHEKPNFTHSFSVNAEIKHLKQHLSKADRRIPARTSKNLLIATWNLTNFGLQKRQRKHLKLMASILEPFDVVAVQEIADNLTHLEQLVDELGDEWDYYYTDTAGNAERLGYLYRYERVQPIGLAAELAMRGYERMRIQIEEVEESFEGFNRNPYMLGFSAGDFEFTLVNVHLYWSNFSMRRLETMALAKWAKSRVKKGHPPNNDIILIGDFNMPGTDPSDPIFRELKRQGIRLPDHDTEFIGSNLAGDKFYDQIAFFPNRTAEDFAGRMGVLDFDNAIFPNLFKKNKTQFYQFIRYYIADHRPLWAEFRR